MTIQQLKKLNQKNGGFFFNRETMKHFGDTLKNLSISPPVDGLIEVRRIKPLHGRHPGRWTFLEKTGRVFKSHTSR